VSKPQGALSVQRKSAEAIVCAGQRPDQEGSSPSGARMRGAISESGGNASLAGEREWCTCILCCSLCRKAPGGQGVHCEVESEGHEEKYRAVIKGATPLMNRSAKGGARSSLHYGGEGATHPPIAPRCLRAARYGRSGRDPRRTHRVPGWRWGKRPYKSQDEVGNEALRVVGQPSST